MKKTLILLFLILASLPALAQGINYPSYNHRVIANGFFDNWFVSLGLDNSASYSDQERSATQRMGYNPFSCDRASLTMNMAVGKWLTHTFALRFKVSGFSSKRMGTTLDGRDVGSYRLWTYELQPLINLHNLFGGYKERVWDASLYAGMGIARNYGSSDFTVPRHSSWIATLGLVNTFHLNRRVYINVDISASAAEAGLDGVACPVSTTFPKDRDCLVRFGVGVGINIGRVGWRKAPDMEALMDMNQAEVDALNLSIQELEAENARLRSSQGDASVECEIPAAPEIGQ